MNTSLINYDKKNNIKEVLEKLQQDMPDRPIMKIYNRRGSLAAVNFLWQLGSEFVNYNETLKEEFLKEFSPYDKRTLYRGLSIRTKEEITKLNDMYKLIKEWNSEELIVSTSSSLDVATKFSKAKMIPESYFGDNPELSSIYYNVIIKVTPRLICDVSDFLGSEEKEVAVYGVEDFKIISIEKQLYLLEDELDD